MSRTPAGPMPESAHGTKNGYGYWRCRCAACCEANTEVCNTSRARAVDKPIPDHVHGTTNGYGYWHCRCDDCVAANTEACKRYRIGR